jgi:hypothetical protein
VWELYGSQAPFPAGVGIVTISLVLSQYIHSAPDRSAPVSAVVR